MGFTVIIRDGCTISRGHIGGYKYKGVNALEVEAFKLEGHLDQITETRKRETATTRGYKKRLEMLNGTSRRRIAAESEHKQVVAEITQREGV